MSGLSIVLLVIQGLLLGLLIGFGVWGWRRAGLPSGLWVAVYVVVAVFLGLLGPWTTAQLAQAIDEGVQTGTLVNAGYAIKLIGTVSALRRMLVFLLLAVLVVSDVVWLAGKAEVAEVAEGGWTGRLAGARRYHVALGAAVVVLTLLGPAVPWMVLAAME